MISAQFFTTINLWNFLDTLNLLTFKLPYLRFWKDNDLLIEEFKNYLNAQASKVYTFYNWRSALFWVLKSLNLKKDDEVIISWYTCVSVVNAVKQSWAKPVYADIDNSLNITLDSIKKVFSSKTKVIIVQHTFWNPAKIDEIVNWAHNHWLIVIEDVAHALWASIWPKKVWTFGDLAIFSTWRDKVISSVTGGLLVINNDNIKISFNLIPVSKKLAFQNLMYNIIAYMAWKTYDIKLWKVLMYLANKFKLIPPILTPNEKACNFDIFYYQLPNSLAYLASKQLKKIDKINEHRKKIAKFYKDQLVNSKNVDFVKVEPFYDNIYFWFPILIKDQDIWNKLVKEWKKRGIYFGIYWSGKNIVPSWTDLVSCEYKPWSCPNAEKYSKQVLILPNHYQISLKDAKKVVELIKKVLW